MKFILQVIALVSLIVPIHLNAYDCDFIAKQIQAKQKDDELIRNEIVELNSKIAVVIDANKQIEVYKNKQHDYFQSNVIKMTAYLGYQTYKEIKPISGVNSFKQIFEWTRSKVGAYITFESASVGGYTPNLQSISDQFSGELEKQLWGKGYYSVHIKPIQSRAGEFVKAVNELKKFENYTLDAYRAYAHQTTDYGKDGKITDTKDTSMVLFRGKTLVQKCEEAQEALKKIRYELPRTIEQFKEDRKQIKKELERLVKRYKECLKFSPKLKAVNEEIQSEIKDTVKNQPGEQYDRVPIDNEKCDDTCNKIEEECAKMQISITQTDKEVKEVFEKIGKKIKKLVEDHQFLTSSLKAGYPSLKKRFLEMVRHNNYDIAVDRDLENMRITELEASANISYYKDLLALHTLFLSDYESEIKMFHEKMKALALKIEEAKELTLYSNYCNSCSSHYIFSLGAAPCGYPCNRCREGSLGQNYSPPKVNSFVKKQITDYRVIYRTVESEIKNLKVEIQKKRDILEGIPNLKSLTYSIRSQLSNRKSQCDALLESFNVAKKEKCALYEKIDDLYSYLVTKKVMYVNNSGIGIEDKWIMQSSSKEAKKRIRKWYFMFDDYFYDLEKKFQEVNTLNSAVSSCIYGQGTRGLSSYSIFYITNKKYDLQSHEYCKRGSYGEAKYGLDSVISRFLAELPAYIDRKKTSFENQEVAKKYNKYWKENLDPNAKYTEDIQARKDYIKRMEFLQVQAKDEEKNREKIINFYREFQELYQAQDIPSLSSKLAANWSASEDDMSIDDLEEYLGSSFEMFDEVLYKISEINIEKKSQNRYIVTYNLEIIGEIYDNEIEHIEKSMVREELSVNNNRVLIQKTMSGQFWLIQ